MDDAVSLLDLEKAFCPPLDPALFSAIASDYDLSDPSNLHQLRDTLNALKATADEQQDLPFDPSGTGGLSAADLLGNDDGCTSRNDTIESRETDITSLRSDLSSLQIDGEERSTTKTYIIGPDGLPCLTGMTTEEKTRYLAEMFPSVAEYTIKHTLVKCDSDMDRAMDVLLNLAFFNSQDSQSPADEDARISIPKGIDGFVSPQGPKRKGKNKKSKAKGRISPYLSDTNEPSSPVRNKWDDAKDDLDFIYSRTAPVLKRETITSAYHQNHASRSKTIRCLATAHAPERASEDATVVAQVAELVQEFPTIAIPTLEGLLNITGHSVSAASELARATLSQPSHSLSDIIRIDVPAPVLDDGEEDAPSKKRGPTASHGQTDYMTAQSSASAHFTAGSTAFVKASAAYRRGKSDRLMGGAAAYYASVGREHLEKAKRENAAAADALVSAQSSADTLDLHGVSVQDGVRIASDRVSRWWESLGDSKYALGRTRQDSYKIITGAGRHSRDGTSRLGPAVGKMLAREGWKVEVGQGVLVVTGR